MLKEISIIKNGGIVNRFTNKKEDYKELMVITTSEQTFVVDIKDKLDITNRTETIAVYDKKTKIKILF